jgi:hypothetical protein
MGALMRGPLLGSLAVICSLWIPGHAGGVSAGDPGASPARAERDWAPRVASDGATTRAVRAVPLGQVRLLPGPLKDRQDLHRRVILGYDPERLLHNFRVNAGLPSAARPYGGWEAPTIGLRGHFTGHYLSACALMYAATGDERFKARVHAMVTALAEVHRALGGGYLSAFPASVFDTLERTPFDGVWAPYYTIHKIMAGLIDAHEHAGNAEALEVALAMARYFEDRVARLSSDAIDRMTRTDYKGNPVNEFGGFAESLLALHRITGDERRLRLARVFMRDWFIDPLARREDRLAGLHANTHVPQATSFAQAPAGVDDRLLVAARFFWKTVTNRHSFAFGGNAFDEKFRGPGVEAADLTDLSGESCNTHNMLKLTRALFERGPDAEYADYYEHALYNHLLATIAPDTGATTYFMPARPGAFKVYGDPEESLWCCTGSGIENTARYGEAIYFEAPGALWVNLFIPSTVELPGHGARVTLQTAYPTDGVVRLSMDAAPPARFALHLRVPAWAGSAARVRVNGRQVSAGAASGPSRYVAIDREWNHGDEIELRLPMTVRMRPAMDDPQVVSFFYGPILLAGDLGTDGMPPSDLVAKSTQFRATTPPAVPGLRSVTPASLRRVEGQGTRLRFRAALPSGTGGPRTVDFVPLYELHHRRYSIYWRAAGTAPR